jgi:hypothetical protein
MVRKFYWSRSFLAAERSDKDGNESTASISDALGMFQVGLRQQTGTMSDPVIESLQEIVSKMNKAERGSFPICGVLILGDQGH